MRKFLFKKPPEVFIRKLLFKKPPEVFACCIVVPILVHMLCAYYLNTFINPITLLLLVTESLIMFHVYTLVRDLDPECVYREVSYVVRKNNEYSVNDVELEHLRNWYIFAQKEGFLEIEKSFHELIGIHILRQKIQSMQKQDLEDDEDDGVLA